MSDGVERDGKPIDVDEAGAALDRDEIDAEKVRDLTTKGLIRLFTMRLATYDSRHDYSKSRCVGEVAKEFRDDYRVNILRVLDEVDYRHPDSGMWNIRPIPERTIRKFDPVLPEAKREGGTADFRAGDVLELDGDPLVIVGVGETKLVGMNKSGEMAVHPIAVVRELFNSTEHSPRLIRDGDVVRGPEDREVGAATERSEK